MQTFALSEYAALLPIIACALAGVLALVVDVYLRRGSKTVLSWISLAGVVLAAISAAAVWTGPNERPVLGGAIAVSELGFGLALGVLVAAAAASLYSAHYAEGTSVASGEHYGLLLLGTSGMLALVVANDLATLFVALETLSICVYALTGLFRAKARSAEGAMKYFLLGAFSSGFLLYGIALVYAAAGTLRLDTIHARGLGPGGPLAVAGVALILVGLLFKVGAVPFHAWVPDAYEGAPASVTGFMSVAVKAAAFGAALRVLAALGPHASLAMYPGRVLADKTGVEHLAEGGMQLGWVLWAAAALTMIVGNAGAFTQRNPRRLLAYSGIAHTGYALCGLVAIARFADTARGLGAPGLALDVAAKDGAAGVIFYMVGYGVANLAAFSVLCYLERGGEDLDDIAQLSGLARTRPLAALALTISMISLAGVPLTSGFVAKLWVFKAAVAAGNTGLVVIAVLTSALSLGYYLGPVVRMYMRAPLEESAAASLAGDAERWGPRLSLGLLALATVVLGVVPGKVLEIAETGAGALF